MIERTFILVDGPPKGGKTTLIEHLLRAFDGFAFVARCHRADNLRVPQETRPARSVELRRYREAGADDAIRYRFPFSHAHDESFFLTELMADYSDSVILEGNRPTPYVDLSVYVADPCGEGAALLVRKVRDRAREEAEKIDAMERLLDEPGGIGKIIEESLGKEIGSLLSMNSGRLDEFRDQFVDLMEKARRAPPPEPTEHWAIADGYDGIERAQVVVVNLRFENQRERAEGMLAELRRIRGDEEVFADVLAPLGKRTPITAVVAKLSDPSDPGTRKIVARIKRSMKGT